MAATARFRLIWRQRHCKSPTLCSRYFSMAPEINVPIEEALLPDNRLRNFHPTHPGEFLDERFKTIAKLGFGGGSTVWLAENLKFNNEEESIIPRFVSIKIAALDTNASRETKYLKLITNAQRSHDGLGFIRTPVDEFKLKGPVGTHSCLVYEPMRETLYQFQHQLERRRLPPELFQFYIYCLLHALDYLHTECHLIHTDIKDDNIMITIENDSVLTEYAQYHTQHPHPRYVRSQDGHVVYLSQDNFGSMRGGRLLPMLSDFNLTLPGLDGDLGHLSAIQSHRFRAPEVFLGCAWSYSADIWNFGLLLWNLLEDVSLFDRPAGEDGEYDAHVHLAQMVSLLGNPPEELIQRERMYRKRKLNSSVKNFRGTECETMNEFWGGPFFNDENEILRKDLVTEGRKLADTVTELSGDEKRSFLDLASGMLQWLPEKRKTAAELLQHPFFDSVRKERAGSGE